MAGEILNYSPAGGRVYKEDSSVLNWGNILEASMGMAGMVVVTDTAKKTAATDTYYGATTVDSLAVGELAGVLKGTAGTVWCRIYHGKGNRYCGRR